VHYASDTEPGSSGSPVLNDQFEVIALHHKSVPRFDAKGRIRSRDNKIWTPSMGEDQIAWIANEGVRISRIFVALDRLKHHHPHALSLLSLLENGQPKSVFSALPFGAAPSSRTLARARP
jgi:hypothetical protein